MGAMILVAVTRWACAPENEAPALAPLLGEAVYDLRLRLARPLPVMLARVDAPERARALLAALRARGHGAIACDLTYVPSSQAMMTPRSYRFEADAFVGSGPAQATGRMPYADMLALLRARDTTVEEIATSTKERKFSFGRAAMTGGLILSKSKTKSARSTSEQSEQVLYLIRRDGREPMLLREGALRHEGLGEQIRPTALENFALVVASLRERAPQALYDERLMIQARNAASLRLSGTPTDRRTTQSNSDENDMAAHVIAIAFRSGQL
jgi:hypothetical protein